MRFAALSLLVLNAACQGESETQDTEAPAMSEMSPEEDPTKKGHLVSLLNNQQEEDLALAINAAGYLCAKVIGALPVNGRIIVECTEYRGKSDEENSYVRYMIAGLEEGRNMRVYKSDVLTEAGWQKASD